MTEEVELGMVIISIDNRVVGIVHNLTMSIGQASLEELKAVQESKILVLYRPQGSQPLKTISPVAHERVTVTPKRYLEVLNASRYREYVLSLKAWEVPILHGLVALAADHPGIQKLSEATHAIIIKIRHWCRAVFTDWGFSPAEVLYLDTMREDFQGNITPEEEPMNDQTTPEHDECLQLLNRLTIDLKKKAAGRKHAPITEERVAKVIEAIKKEFAQYTETGE
jgi:hypothetical protein